MKSIFQASLLSLFALALTPASHAAWPDKPIKLIVPAAPGGTTDITARLLSEKIGAELGTTIVVENRAGAAGIIGTQALIQAPPDGYTIGFGNIGPNGINYSLYKKLPYKPTDFSPITLVISVPNVMVVNSKSPYNNVKELVDAIKKDPKGNYTFASSVPTMAEAGIKDMVVTAWFGFVAPAGTPPAIVDKIQQATKKVLSTPEIQKRFAEMGGVPGGGTPAEFGAFMDNERESWRKIVEAAKLQME